MQRDRTAIGSIPGLSLAALVTASMFALAPPAMAGGSFVRGDANDDGAVDIADAIHTLGFLFSGGPAASCPDAADANDDGTVDIADAVAVLGHLFSGAGPLPSPFPAAGIDPTVDALSCGGTPLLLSQDVLFSDIAAGIIAAGIEEYAPNAGLWSDGASVQRWVRLPPGVDIDNTDEDDWVLPAGTILWRELRIGGTPVETQRIEQSGAGAGSIEFSTYRWFPGGADAEWIDGGALDVNGTAHDILPVSACASCHGGSGSATGTPHSRALGFAAVSLSPGGGGLSYGDLVSSGRLVAPGPPAGYPRPGTAVDAAALDYLHGNCASCHAPGTPLAGFLGLDLSARSTDSSLFATGVWTTAVAVPTSLFGAGAFLISPGQPDDSAIVLRAESRGTMIQMPPLATEAVDTAGTQLLRSWILGL